jgi:hypothetical protein
MITKGQEAKHSKSVLSFNPLSNKKTVDFKRKKREINLESKSLNDSKV